MFNNNKHMPSQLTQLNQCFIC